MIEVENLLHKRHIMTKLADSERLPIDVSVDD